MAPTRTELLMDAPGGLERLGVGGPAPVPADGPAAAHAAMVADMRIATHEEAQALLQGSGLPGGADVGAGTATLSALLDRLGAAMPSSAMLTPALHGVAAADLDCALFAEDVRVRRLLGVGDPHKPGDGVGPESAMELDVPIRCIAKIARTVPPSAGRQTFQPAPDQGTKISGAQHWQTIETWVRPDSAWLMALVGSAVALVVFGLVSRVRAHDTIRRRARGEALDHRWR